MIIYEVAKQNMVQRALASPRGPSFIQGSNSIEVTAHTNPSPIQRLKSKRQGVPQPLLYTSVAGRINICHMEFLPRRIEPIVAPHDMLPTNRRPDLNLRRVLDSK
jgi:hypothetical protein